VAFHPRRADDHEAEVEHLESTWKTMVMGGWLTLMVLANMLWMFAPSTLSAFQLPGPDAVRWLGAVVGLASTALLLWTHHVLGANYDPLLHVDPEQHLIVDGPYAWVRHPMYTALLGVSLATLLTTANLLPGLTWLLGVGGVVYSRLEPEEALMRQRFGDAYAGWAARTGRLLPWW
jgi:protein-S-isoprenylcysteine O-methyltransferase Ste14